MSATKAAPKPYRSGFCGKGNPPTSHEHCPREYQGRPCICDCHVATADDFAVALMEHGLAETQGRVGSTIPDDPTGLHPHIPEDEYHSHPTSLSVTGAKLLLKSPALYLYRRTNPEVRDVFDFGKAAHAKVLGVGAEIVVHKYDADKVKSPKSTNAWKTEQTEARDRGAVLLLPDEYERICEMVAALERVPLIQQLMKDGEPEVSAFCVDEATGVMRRSRFDLLDDLLIDYKTTIDAEPQAFARSAAKYGYPQQASWYEQIALDLGRRVRGFLFVAQEKTPPYLTSVTELTADAVARGAELNRRALERFRDCTESGRWPGYSDDIVPIDVPRYYYNDQESA